MMLMWITMLSMMLVVLLAMLLVLMTALCREHTMHLQP